MGRAALATAAGLGLASCSGTASPPSEEALAAARLEATLAALPVAIEPGRWARVSASSPVPPVPADPTNAVADDHAAAVFGRALFFDPRLSDDGQTSCATCHLPERGYADGELHRVAPGDHLRRTPGLANVGHLRWLGWDGRKDSLWSQALGPLEAAREQNTSRVHVVRTVREDPTYAAVYASVFGPFPALDGLEAADPLARPVWHGEDDPASVAWSALEAELRGDVDRVFSNLGKAIAAYERLLVSGPAPFDRFVEAVEAGDGLAAAGFDAAVLRGLDLFFGDAGCHNCHNGPLFTDYEFHDTLLPFEDDGRPDRGRHLGIELVRDNPFNGLGEFSDDPEARSAQKLRFLPPRPHQYAEFKTPSLRQVDQGPFMHRGEFADLRAVLEHYNELAGARANAHGGEQLIVPLGLSDADLDDLEAFLGSLHGPPPPAALGVPPTPAELRSLVRP